jgi:NAD(P)-dependent dehydrogenase (short-subunit alcohol dehydrogenase family)
MAKAPPLKELTDLSRHCALVTGGASGIGYATALRLAEAGAAVMIVDANAEKGQSAAAALRAGGYRVDFIVCDISSEEQIKTAVAQTVAGPGSPDILVNNAGVFPATPLEAVSAEKIENILAVNLKGLIYLCRECAGCMINSGHGGTIINITSVDALHPIRNLMSVYDASKGAVLSFSRSLAKELAEKNIRVNAVAPGGIFTEGAVSGSRGEGRVF